MLTRAMQNIEVPFSWNFNDPSVAGMAFGAVPNKNPGRPRPPEAFKRPRILAILIVVDKQGNSYAERSKLITRSEQ